MSTDKPSSVEQDKVTFRGPDELPSYDELAAHNGPNSRFGRWRGWIEKRARERYADLTLEEYERRRARGWEIEPNNNPPSSSLPTTAHRHDQTSRPPAIPLHIRTSNLSTDSDEATLVAGVPPPASNFLGSQPLPFSVDRVPSSHLKICQFGSRFLPHATSQIRCLLPILGDRYLLIGHDEGLSVLDMFPQEWSESGILINKGPSEAICRQIWVGESVHQMTILEAENTTEGTPSGIVLALVGPELGYAKDGELPRTLRMYNLASLVSLAKWAISTKGAHPLDLYKCNGPNTSKSTPSKKHRAQHSITGSFKQQHHSPSRNPGLEIPSSYTKSLSPDTGTYRRSISPPLPPLPDFENASPESQWEFIDFENLPLRWANDHVPLASPGSRLVNQSILSYAFWCDENRTSKGGQLLAVATKNNILLYETPKGERAFRFVKDFYTPYQPRTVAFFHQNVQIQQESSGRGHGHRRTDSNMTIRNGGNFNNPRASYVPSTLQDYGNHLSLYVVFDKKAGWIRITDSVVGEMDLFDDGGLSTMSASSSTSSSSSAHHGHHHSTSSRDSIIITSPTIAVRRIRHSIEMYAANKWGPPITKLNLPFEPGVSTTPSQILFITRGKQTHLVPCPLPSNHASYPPLWTARWKLPPTHVSGRVYNPELLPLTEENDEDEGEDYHHHHREQKGKRKERRDMLPFIQIVAFGEGGIEVQEVPIGLLVMAQGRGKEKGRARVPPDPLRAHEDLGGPVGFLCKGGRWDDYVQQQSSSSSNSSSTADLSRNSSRSDIASCESEEMLAKHKKQEGVYGWWCKDLQDWRVFWIGGSAASALSGDDEEGDDDDDYL